MARNNICEICNEKLLDARFRSTITMLEEIKLMTMNRVIDKRRLCKLRFKGEFHPKIWTKIEENKLEARRCHLE